LQRNVGRGLRLGGVLLHHLALMQKHARNLAARQFQKDFFGTVGYRLRRRRGLEGQSAILIRSGVFAVFGRLM
jgi:hypothetical protein